MSVVYEMPAKIARMEAVRDLLADGNLEITDGLGWGDLIATFSLAGSAGAVDGSAVLTLAFDALAGDAEEWVSGGGAPRIATQARLTTSGNVAIITGLTVENSGVGGDIELNNTSIATQQTITISTRTITHA